VEIPAGKTQQVAIELNPSSFEFFDWSQWKMMVTPGEYEVYFGNSPESKNLKSKKNNNQIINRIEIVN
jgi:beta-glucosidase